MLRKDAHSAQRGMAAGAAALRRECAPSAHFFRACPPENMEERGTYMSLLHTALENKKTAVVLGHMNPDGDCVGSCLAVYNYLKDCFPQVEVTVYLDQPAEKYAYLNGFYEIRTEMPENPEADLCICLDSGDRDRLGDFLGFLDQAGESLCVDHHITNTGYGDKNVVDADASSTCEVLYSLMEEEGISKETAECLYTGIIHDTGVFQYSNTSIKTMEIAGKLMAKGVDFSTIISDSFYRKTYVQKQILGRALLESILFCDGKCIFSVLRKKDMEFYGVTSKDMGGIVEQLRTTDGVECAIFLYEKTPQEFKVSLRSNKQVDVSRVASYFGGGGHVRAAGCTMNGSIHDVVNNLSKQIVKQLGE